MIIWTAKGFVDLLTDNNDPTCPQSLAAVVPVIAERGLREARRDPLEDVAEQEGSAQLPAGQHDAQIPGTRRVSTFLL